MNLPQYNDPALHGLELRPKKKLAGAATGEDASAAEEITELAAADGTSQDESATVTAEATDTSNVAATAGSMTGETTSEMADGNPPAKETSGEAASADSGSATTSAPEHVAGEPETPEPVVILSSDGSTSGEE